MISEAGTSIKDLGADALLDLGGLKTRCSVQIKCTEHGHIIPCEICLHEDRVGSFCDACGKILDTPPLPGDRECSSVEQFNLTGRVAFETDALAALSERESKRKEKKDSELPAERRPLEPAAPAWPATEDSSSPSKSERDLSGKDTSVTDSTDLKVWEDFKRKHRGKYYIVPSRPRLPVSPAPDVETHTSTHAPDYSPLDYTPVRIDSADSRPSAPVDKRPRRERVPRESADTPYPVRDTPHPVRDTPHPVRDTPHPVRDTPHPVRDTSRLVRDTSGSTLEIPSHYFYETPDPIYETPSAPAPAKIPDTAGETISLLSIWAALVAAIAGAYVMFHGPWIEGSTRSNWYALAFAVSTLVIWVLGVTPLLGKERAHRTMSWWSPAIWAFLAAPWPAVGAYLLCKTGGPGQTFSEGIFVLIIGLVAAVVLIYQLSSCGIRLTMRAPWPSPLNDDYGTSDDWLWAKIIATVVLNIYLWDFGSALWKTTAVAPVEAPVLTAPLDSLVTAVNAPTSYARLRNGPELDRIAKALAVIDASPKPATGDVEKARKLQQEAQTLISKGNLEQAFSLLALAHKASPAADSISISLGLTESLTGRHDEAHRHLSEGLTINPRNSLGWRTLGSNEIRRGKGTEFSIHRASEYYVAAWWFAKDRKRLQQLLAREASTNAAMKEAVQRMQKTISR